MSTLSFPLNTLPAEFEENHGSVDLGGDEKPGADGDGGEDEDFDLTNVEQRVWLVKVRSSYDTTVNSVGRVERSRVMVGPGVKLSLVFLFGGGTRKVREREERLGSRRDGGARTTSATRADPHRVCPGSRCPSS